MSSSSRTRMSWTLIGSSLSSFHRTRLYLALTKKVDEWVSVLQLATRWHFKDIRRLAIQELQALQMEPVDRIALSAEHRITGDWALNAYAHLCQRPEPLSVNEAKKLGPDTTAMISQVREEMARMDEAADTPESPTQGHDYPEIPYLHLANNRISYDPPPKKAAWLKVLLKILKGLRDCLMCRVHTAQNLGFGRPLAPQYGRLPSTEGKRSLDVDSYRHYIARSLLPDEPMFDFVLTPQDQTGLAAVMFALHSEIQVETM